MGPLAATFTIATSAVSGAESPAAGFVGEAAALGAASCWVFTAMAFAAAGRRVGPTVVNLVRIIAAFVLLSAIVLLFGGGVPDLERRAIVILLVSGAIGLAIGDQFLFASFLRIGPRIGTLIGTTTAPPAVTIIAWHTLGEALSIQTLEALAFVFAGITIVLLDRATGRARTHTADTSDGAHRGERWIGPALALAAGLCQAVGYVLAKIALEGHGASGASEPSGSDGLDPLTATWIRMGAAVPVIVLISIMVRRWRGPAGRRAPLGRRDRGIAIAGIAIGTIFGPVFGVWLSMVAADLAKAGVGATLMATSPILILPFSAWLDRERIGVAAIAGSVLAVYGVAYLAAI